MGRRGSQLCAGESKDKNTIAVAESIAVHKNASCVSPVGTANLSVSLLRGSSNDDEGDLWLPIGGVLLLLVSWT